MKYITVTLYCKRLIGWIYDSASLAIITFARLPIVHVDLTATELLAKRLINIPSSQVWWKTFDVENFMSKPSLILIGAGGHTFMYRRY